MITPLVPLTHVQLLELERKLEKPKNLEETLMLIGVRHVIAQNELDARMGKSDAPQIPSAGSRMGYLGQNRRRS